MKSRIHILLARLVSLLLLTANIGLAMLWVTPVFSLSVARRARVHRIRLFICWIPAGPLDGAALLSGAAGEAVRRHVAGADGPDRSTSAICRTRIFCRRKVWRLAQGAVGGHKASAGYAQARRSRCWAGLPEPERWRRMMASPYGNPGSAGKAIPQAPQYRNMQVPPDLLQQGPMPKARADAVSNGDAYAVGWMPYPMPQGPLMAARLMPAGRCRIRCRTHDAVPDAAGPDADDTPGRNERRGRTERTFGCRRTYAGTSRRCRRECLAVDDAVTPMTLACRWR